MKGSAKWYAGSLVVAVVFSIFGELIWIGDPLRMGSLYWMDLLQILIRVTAIIPLMWTAGAYYSWVRGTRKRLPVLQLLIAAGGLLSAMLLALRPDGAVLVAYAAGITAALVLLDSLITERRGGADFHGERYA